MRPRAEVAMVTALAAGLADTNVSPDIRAIFGRACDALGVEWRPHNRRSLSVARRGSVALLDGFVGPKR